MRKKSPSLLVGLLGTVLLLGACSDADDAEPMPEETAGAEMPDEGIDEMPAAAPAGGGAAAAPAAGGSGAVAAGQQIFTGQGLCFTCHGQDGRGRALAPDQTEERRVAVASKPE